MRCSICGNTKDLAMYGSKVICQNCLEKSKTNIILKCRNCGAYGFVKINSVNIERLSAITHLIIDKNLLWKPLIIEFPVCPDCKEAHYESS